jgi:hypothetical protein
MLPSPGSPTMVTIRVAVVKEVERNCIFQHPNDSDSERQGSLRMPSRSKMHAVTPVRI